MGSEKGAGRERRRAIRVSLDAVVEVAVGSSQRLFRSRIRDLSKTGVFILTTSTRPIGTGVNVSIVVEKAEIAFHATGIIVHEVATGPGAGFGVMFTEVQDPAALDALIALGLRASEDEALE